MNESVLSTKNVCSSTHMHTHAHMCTPMHVSSDTVPFTPSLLPRALAASVNQAVPPLTTRFCPEIRGPGAQSQPHPGSPWADTFHTLPPGGQGSQLSHLRHHLRKIKIRKTQAPARGTARLTPPPCFREVLRGLYPPPRQQVHFPGDPEPAGSLRKRPQNRSLGVRASWRNRTEGQHGQGAA